MAHRRRRTSATIASGSRRPASTRRSSSRCPASSRASFFCSTDADNNQIASFYTGAMANAGRAVVPHRQATAGLAIISPNDPGGDGAVRRRVPHAGHPLHLRSRASSARACPATSCATACVGAAIVICNDYEFELIRQKTGLTRRASLGKAGALIVTRGEHGSSVTRRAAARWTCRPSRRIASSIRPGVGDAFRGGLIKGLAMGAVARDQLPTRQRRRHLRARASRRPEPRVYAGRSSRPVTPLISAHSDLAARVVLPRLRLSSLT